MSGGGPQAMLDQGLWPDSDLGAPNHRNITLDMRDERSLLSENSELKNQNEFMRSLGTPGIPY